MKLNNTIDYVLEIKVETTTAPLTTEIPCPDGFNRTTEGCFYVENTDKRNRNGANSFCRGLGSNIYLATIDTQEVRIWTKDRETL